MRPNYRLLFSLAAMLFAAPLGNWQSGHVLANELTKLRVGTLPISDLAPLYLGIELGYFKEEGIDVQPVLQPGGPQVVAGLVAGEIDVGWSATPGTIIAAARNMPIRVVAPGIVSPDSPSRMSGQPIVVIPDSHIRTVKDLEGKSLAINARANLLQIMISAAMSKAGADPTTVKWVEMPFPDMLAALVSKQIDVAALPEPFYTQARETGQGRAIFDAFHQPGSSMPIAHWVAVNAFAQKNGDTLARFKRAIAKASRSANENPEAARKAILTFTRISPELVNKISLNLWSEDVDLSGLKLIEQLTRQYGPRGLAAVNVEKLILSEKDR